MAYFNELLEKAKRASLLQTGYSIMPDGTVGTKEDYDSYDKD